MIFVNCDAWRRHSQMKDTIIDTLTTALAVHKVLIGSLKREAVMNWNLYQGEKQVSGIREEQVQYEKKKYRKLAWAFGGVTVGLAGIVTAIIILKK